MRSLTALCSSAARMTCAAAEPLRPLYEEFNDWILEYDREKIEGLFRPSCDVMM
ncbi:DUF3885 domain-containing protein [Paenibacillus melissococcoides]|uniref:DUF3885 domain-containing protein n=1 Tax=Paenibacillus melissococcoides TaxID=2912268 RepID=A0ABN8UAS9_9BACL|nr:MULTISPECIES: DUF3885 domain-containing protein [Paenibacillus]MEB9892469.1 DUF3885 domain-containing protein [Bacillus cereus]CAH8248268.1 DUF3885 domain-containing protein [Paenibacillus melissococcoides]CAH8717990.1 DUF3885 domain-containing protein [Paenibacillus melissococcoides]CAH8719131.1 DUF3885 domain-containing protein [Paenibacillus melissococcoides]